MGRVKLVGVLPNFGIMEQTPQIKEYLGPLQSVRKTESKEDFSTTTIVIDKVSYTEQINYKSAPYDTCVLVIYTIILITKCKPKYIKYL